MIPLEIRIRKTNLDSGNRKAILTVSRMVGILVMAIIILSSLKKSYYSKYFLPETTKTEKLQTNKFDAQEKNKGICFTELKNIFDKHSKKWRTKINIVANLDKVISSEKKSTHFVFIGDSRIRQHFLNVLKIIPNYDLEYEPRFISSYKVHEDMNVTSKLLSLRISFYFRRWLTFDTTEVFFELLHTLNTDIHRVTLTGISIHHMLDGNGSVNLEQYKKNLTDLKPNLESIIKSGPVIWLNQYPAIDIFGPFNSHLEIFSEKIYHYNLVTEHILSDTGVTLWNSGNIWAEEYIRSCFLLERADNWKINKKFGYSYFNCLDYVHPGYVAMGETIRFFIFKYLSLEQYEKYI